MRDKRELNPAELYVTVRLGLWMRRDSVWPGGGTVITPKFEMFRPALDALDVLGRLKQARHLAVHDRPWERHDGYGVSKLVTRCLEGEIFLPGVFV